MVKLIDPAALDPDTLRPAARGAKEVLKASLSEMIDAMDMAGEEFDDKDLETLVLAGRMAEEADWRDGHQK